MERNINDKKNLYEYVADPFGTEMIIPQEVVKDHLFMVKMNQNKAKFKPEKVKGEVTPTEILDSGPRYKPEKWVKNKAHFDYIYLFEKIIEEREKRELCIEKAKKAGVIMQNENLLDLINLANVNHLTDEEEVYYLKQAKRKRMMDEKEKKES